MKTLSLRTAKLLLASLVVLAMVPASASSAGSPRRSIVVFENAAANAAATEHIQRIGGVKVKDLPLIGGAVVNLPATVSDNAIARVPGVRYVEPDGIATALGKKPTPPPPPPPAQTTPWGVSRVGAPVVWPTYTGDPIKVAVVDTGIDTSHPDLATNVKGGTSAVRYTTSYNDDDGHGTHVAGIIAAVDNTIGVVGVAPAADLYAVKVLDRNGRGYLSDIIEGLQWAIENDMDVVNMSLGTSSYSQSFDSAVKSVIGSGIVVVAAAGNSGPTANSVNYPAKFAGVIAVSATDSNNAIASWSSRGPEVDLAAPGVSIYSTYYKQSYGTLSGTSMASPHVAGVVALVLQSPIGTDDLDRDHVWDPNEVEKRLEDTAQNLGPAGWDTDFGYGLVRAGLAVQL
jgi:subtilisin